MQSQRHSPPRRGDGAVTRAQLLEMAGQVFAEMGFDRATGREITERAGTNSAAINYYFGGFESLYAEVLVQAHKRVASIEDVSAVAEAATIAPEEKLRQLIAIGVASLRSGVGSWPLRVLSREFLAPTSARARMEENEIVPKRRLVARVVADVLGLAEDDPVVDRGCFSVMAPITMLFVCDPMNAARAFPACCGEGTGEDALVDHLHTFALGGLRAIAEQKR
jgi:AcrR family transcriptional regulator